MYASFVTQGNLDKWLKESEKVTRLTLLTGFSGAGAGGSGDGGLPLVEGVRLILGEWNLSMSFMVDSLREERWERGPSAAPQEERNKQTQKYITDSASYCMNAPHSGANNTATTATTTTLTF